jgi:hypothetical protein
VRTREIRNADAVLPFTGGRRRVDWAGGGTPPPVFLLYYEVV